MQTEKETKAKRLVSEVGPDAFWKIKEACATKQINQKDVIALSTAYILGVPLELVCDKVEVIAQFKKLVKEAK